MYVRQPDPNRQRVKIPENYSGHAFRDGSPYNDMPPPTRIDLPPTERSLPSAPESFSPDAPTDPRETTFEKEDDNHYDSESVSAPTNAKPSIFSSLLPTNFASASHFPFGHGIGSEEILILAMMLLVFLSDKNGDTPDHELLLLLGLLLFAG